MSTSQGFLLQTKQGFIEIKRNSNESLLWCTESSYSIINRIKKVTDNHIIVFLNKVMGIGDKGDYLLRESVTMDLYLLESSEHKMIIVGSSPDIIYKATYNDANLNILGSNIKRYGLELEPLYYMFDKLPKSGF